MPLNKKETPSPEVPTQMIPQKNDIVQFDPETQIKQATNAANALVKVLQPLDIKGKKYFTFEHWQTIAKFYGYTVGTESTKPLMSEGKITGYEATSAVYNNQGLKVGGAEAICTRQEKTWSTRDEYAIKSMAQTRAMAKGLRSILGYVAVLAGAEATPAEEVPYEGFNDKPEPRAYKPTQKQLSFIERLATEKGYTMTDVKRMQELDPKNPSELIDYLKVCPAKNATHIDVEGQVIDEHTGKPIDVPFGEEKSYTEHYIQDVKRD